MTPNSWVTQLYKAFLKYNVVIYMFGDSNQCFPVEKFLPQHDYSKSPAIKQMMPETIVLEYDQKTGRYDEQTRDYLDYFLKESKLKSALSSTIDSD